MVAFLIVLPLLGPPQDVTEQTLADSATLQALQTPGTVVFQDDFENKGRLKEYFEILGEKEGLVRLVEDPHSGKFAARLTAPSRNGNSSGAALNYYFGPDGIDRAYLRYYQKFATDYDQGNLNHTGAGLTAAKGSNKWEGMGTAGIKPKGDDYFNTALETWRDYQRVASPGYLFFYTYWKDMTIDKDGHYWGNMLGPSQARRVVPKRGQWNCYEIMVKANTPGKNDGELAGWINGKLYIHYKGFEWRTRAEVRLKRFNLSAYVHKAEQDNTVYYDDVVLSTGYVGP